MTQLEKYTQQDYDNLAAEKFCGALAERYGVDPVNLLNTLRSTAFYQGRDKPPLSPHELSAAMMISERYDLDPLAKELYVVRHGERLLIIVPIDGWYRIANRDKRYDGVEFREGEPGADGKLQSITCYLWVKDRAKPAMATEYMRECFVPSSPAWKSHPNRMLRHKAFIQAARMAFSLSGIIDDDDAERITNPLSGIEPREVRTVEPTPAGYLEAPRADRQVAPRAKEPEKAPAAKPKGKVKPLPPPPAPEDLPPEEPMGEVPPEPPPPLPQETFKALWGRWVAVRERLSEAQQLEARAAGPLEFINAKCPQDALERVVQAAERMVA